MSYIKISNDGEIDINALTLLGASSKADDESKIGFFGSGNKYALATFLRNGIGVRIFSGAREFSVATEQLDFRGQNFERIVINGIQTSLTTRTGPEWELWMALREFLCNALDEGGQDWRRVERVEKTAPGRTAIYLEESDELRRVFDDIESVVITGATPAVTVETSYGAVAIYQRNNGRVYRKGVCCSAQWSTSLHAYSFDDIKINESRVVYSEYLVHERIASALAACEERAVVSRFVAAMLGQHDPALLEHQLLRGDYWSSSYCPEHFSSAWRDEFADRGQVLCASAFVMFMPPEDVASYLVLPTGFFEKLIADWPELPHVGDGNSEWVSGVPDARVAAVVPEALEELHELNLTGGENYTVKFVNFVNASDVMSAQGTSPNEILVSATFKDGVDYAAGLLEEITHKVTHAGDGSRALQTQLFKNWLAAERRAARDAAFVAVVSNACALRRQK